MLIFTNSLALNHFYYSSNALKTACFVSCVSWHFRPNFCNRKIFRGVKKTRVSSKHFEEEQHGNTIVARVIIVHMDGIMEYSIYIHI